MKKFSITGLSTLALVLSLTACGKSGGSDGDTYRVDPYNSTYGRDDYNRYFRDVYHSNDDYYYTSCNGYDVYYVPATNCNSGCGSDQWEYYYVDNLNQRSWFSADFQFNF